MKSSREIQAQSREKNENDKGKERKKQRRKKSKKISRLKNREKEGLFFSSDLFNYSTVKLGFLVPQLKIVDYSKIPANYSRWVIKTKKIKKQKDDDIGFSRSTKVLDRLALCSTKITRLLLIPS